MEQDITERSVSPPPVRLELREVVDEKPSSVEVVETPTDEVEVQSPPTGHVDLPEMETFHVELRKDKMGLGITIAGYVCEKGKYILSRQKREKIGY